MEKQVFDKLIQWYQQNARDLPWRNTQNPYHIWISEIMLQQTRVEAVKPYYFRFLEKYPTIQTLAESENDELMKIWEGLGYYSRARNLKIAAQSIVADFGGEMPSNYKDLLSLKGIGTYTAGAIASIAFSLPHAAVDGNVLRVMSRLEANYSDILAPSTKKELEKNITEFLSHYGKANIITQALIELGATICIPNGAPKCDLCPWREFCEAYKRNLTKELPVKSPKKARIMEHLNVFFMVADNRIAIRKRNADGLLANLWELPNANQAIALPQTLLEWGVTEANMERLCHEKHIFTHIQWEMDAYFISVAQPNEDFLWLTKEELETTYALPSAFKKIWQQGCKHMHAKKAQTH